MTSLLRPAYELTLGSQRWTEQVTRLAVTLAFAPAVNLLNLMLPAAAPFSAAIGDNAKLKLNNGEKEEVIFTGTIDSVRQSFAAIHICCTDAGAALARLRPAVTFEQVTASTVIKNLAREIGAGTGDLEEGPNFPFYVADPARTAWEHTARVSAWAGAVASVSADNKVQSVVIDASQAQVAMRYGREILAMDAIKLTSVVDAFTVAGEAGAGDAAAPEAMRPTTNFFAGNRPENPGAGRRWRFEPALRTVQAAGTAGAALQRHYGSSRSAGSIHAFMQPQVRCGTVLEVQDLPERLAQGPIWVTRVEHRLGQGKASSIIEYQQGGDRFDPLALLGSLAGLAGGLV